MDRDMEQQLNAWRETLRGEVIHAEGQLEALRKDIQQKREKLTALDQLLGGALPATAAAATEEAVHDDVPVDNRDFTPVQAYWVPILETLVEFGGGAPRLKVIARVGEKMKDVLKPADYEPLPNSFIVRWQNRVPWQASNMREIGFISRESPRGIWEITPKGRKWLDDNR